MPARAPSQKLDQFLLRLPDGMRDKLGTAARANNRTMTAEIISRLENSFPNEQAVQIPGKTGSGKDDMAQQLALLTELVKDMNLSLHILSLQFDNLHAKKRPRSRGKSARG